MKRGEKHAKKAIHGIHQKAMLQQKNIQVLCRVYNIADIDAVFEYKANMGACLGRYIYRCIQTVYYWQIFINKKTKKTNEPVAMTDSRMMS